MSRCPLIGLAAVLTICCGVNADEIQPVAATKAAIRAAAKPGLFTLPRSSRKGADGESFSIMADDVRSHIERLAAPEMRGRRGDDARKAADYLASQFAEYGLQPLFSEDGFFQPILGSAEQTDLGSIPTVIGRNVGGWIAGSDPDLRDEFVMITAHYDHLGMVGGQLHPGADDNASGVAMMLETARTIAALPDKPRRSIVFVGFDLEERLLWGSRWFAAHPPWELSQVKLFITADMIGRSLGDLPLPTVFVLGSERAPALKRVLDDAGCPAGLEMLRLGADLIGTRSDYGPFRDRRVPFLFFSTGEHDDYHTPRDTPDRVDFVKAAQVSTLILRVALAIADADQTPEWTDDVQPNLDEVRAVHRITELVLEADANRDHPLNGFQRLFVSQVHAKTGNAIRLGRLTTPERKWLTHAAQLLLLSVF